MLETLISDAADPLSIVRHATPQDEEEIVEMVRLMHDDGEWGLYHPDGRPFVFSPEKTRATIQCATRQQRNAPDAGQAWLGIVGEPGQLRGSAYVSMHEASMSDGFILNEKWNWCVPEERRGAVSDALIAFSTAIADMKGMRLIMAAMTQRRMGKSRFYERRFGVPIGAVYHYSPITGAAA